MRRLLGAACAIASVAWAPASAQADAVVATTGPGVAAGPTGEYLTGGINTFGGATIWQFEWGTTTGYGHKTPLQTIPAGRGFVVVASPLTGLRPNTIYHFRLDARAEVAGPYGYYYGLGGVGADQTFTTPGAGAIKLSSTKLRVRNGKVSVGLKCASTIACKGRYSATVRGKVHGAVRTISCFSARFSLRAGANHSFTTRVSTSCLSRFTHRRLSGVTLKVTTSTFQPTLTRKVTLRR